MVGLAVGIDGTILRFDNTLQQWTVQNPSITTTTLYGVWGRSDGGNDAWIVGDGGIILHWPGMP